MSRKNGCRSNANMSGQNAEVLLECALMILNKKGYRPIPQFTLTESELRRQPIHSDSLRVDILVRGIAGHEAGLIISSKRQDSSGTSQEKLHYHIEKVIKECYGYPTILLITGNGWHKRVRDYCLKSVDNWLIKVFFDYHELLSWAESVLPITQEAMDKVHEQLPLFRL